MSQSPRPGRASERDSVIWRFAVIAALSGLLFGYDASSINDAISFIATDFDLDSLEKGLVVAALQLGAGIGALVAGFIADRIGRRNAIIISAVLFLVGVSAAALSPDTQVLILARLIIGFAIGVTSAVTPLYIAEISPADKRGGMVTLFQLAITVGIFVAFLAGYALTAEGNWRLMIFLAAVPALLQLLFMRMAPETPRFLMSRGKETQARAVLESTVGADQTDEVLADIRQVMATESRGSYSDIFRRAARPALLAGLGLAIIQAITGINVIMYYSTFIFELAGFAGQGASELTSLVIGVVNMVTTVVAIRLVNRFPRRALLLVGTAGMVVSLLVAGLSLLVHNEGGGTLSGWLTLASSSRT